MTIKTSLLLAALLKISATACAAPGAADSAPAASSAAGNTAAPATLKIDAETGDLLILSEPAPLRVKRPELRQMQATIKAPADYNASVEVWQPWPGSDKERKALAVQFSPRSDEQGVPILGALFRQVIAESIKVTTADGSKTFARDVDYKINDDWCQIMAIDGRLGERGVDDLLISYQLKQQRIDLLVQDAPGKLSVLIGESVLVCPQVPQLPVGTVAGVAVATFYWPGEPAVTTLAEAKSSLPLVLPIKPVQPVAPINPQAVSATLAKLREGKTVRIAFVGDSVTLGAEAGSWWKDDSPHYRNQFLSELRKRFPKATIEQIQAFQGGQGAPFGEKILEEKVLGHNADLLLIAFGLNDAIAPAGKAPSNPPEAFSGQIAGMTRRAKAEGIEVILLTPMQPNPYQKDGLASRITGYNEALAKVAAAEGAALADVYSQWLRLTDEGIPPYSQLHNWLNHPGIRGHRVYAEVLLRFFPLAEK